MKMFTAQIELKGKYELEVRDNSFYVYQNGNDIYYENIYIYWYKSEYDKQGNETYFENSNGFIKDKRPKPIKEVTMEELEKKYGCKIKIVKER